MSGVFTELDDAGLQDALAGARSRNIYGPNMIEFLNSGARGVEVNLADGVHAGKKAQSVKTGYESAKDNLVDHKIKEEDGWTQELADAAKHVKVVMKNDRVYLIRQDA
jgi:hypothetical protein